MSEQATQSVKASDGAERTETGEGRERGKHRRRRRGHQQSGPASTNSPEPTINLDELRYVVELIAKYGYTDFEYEREGIHLRLRKELAPQIATAPIGPVPTMTVQAQPTQAAGQAQPTQTSQSVQQTSAPQSVNVPHPGAQAEAEAAEDADLHKIVSPIIGTFYRATSPGTEPFVKIGSRVENDTIVCIVEAMKLMNEIQAEVSGEVVKIYVENGQPVEYGQPLFGIKK
jgi:acetyl-CoA carboxylase biotin carboxyl carrier protein